MEIVFLGLGANLQTPLYAIQNALEEISNLEQTSLEKVSSLYDTTPVSTIAQDNYLNAACMIKTELSPLKLLEKLQEIEKKLGKTPKPKEAPRVIDIDILFYGKQKITQKDLTIPHKEALNRLFVLVPLKDIVDTIELPKGEKHRLDDIIENFTNIHNETITLYKE